MPTLDTLRARATQHADRLGFTMSSDDETGRLLAVLASSIQRGDRILELGTDVGFGTAALAAALQPRDDVRIVTVEGDADTLTHHPQMVACAIAWSTGLILCSKSISG